MWLPVGAREEVQRARRSPVFFWLFSSSLSTALTGDLGLQAGSWWLGGGIEEGGRLRARSGGSWWLGLGLLGFWFFAMREKKMGGLVWLGFSCGLGVFRGVGWRGWEVESEAREGVQVWSGLCSSVFLFSPISCLSVESLPLSPSPLVREE